MRIRLGSFLMSFILLISVIFGIVPVAYADSSLSTSKTCVDMIKEFEGFNKYAYFDYSQWSIGYGTACNKSDYPSGISREKAEELLKKEIASLEKNINKFAKNNNLTFSQHQFDALISFTYNVGSSWMYDNKQVITQAVINGSAGNDFIFALTRWCIVTENGTRKISTSKIILIPALRTPECRDMTTLFPTCFGQHPPKTAIRSLDGTPSLLADSGVPVWVPGSMRTCCMHTGSREQMTPLVLPPAIPVTVPAVIFMVTLHSPAQWLAP